MKKVKINLELREGGTLECEAELVNEQWAVHLDPFLEKGKHYVLTHVSSGRRVWSSRLKTRLKLLAQEPAFFEELKWNDLRDVKRLSLAVKDFCGRNGWD